MSVDTQNRKQTFTLDGTNKTFTFTFNALRAAPTDIKCKNTTLGTDLTYTTDYSVVVNSDGSGGVVTLVSAGTADHKLLVYRETTDTQESIYDDYNQFPADSVEKDFDRRTLKSQELEEAINRSVKADITSALTGSALNLPSPTAGLALKWGPSANTIINSTYDPDAKVDEASSYATIAQGHSEDADSYATIATDKATEASSYSTIASDKATEADSYSTIAQGHSEDASSYSTISSDKADEAESYSNIAIAKADESSSYATISQSYSESSESYSNIALSAKTDAETAQNGAESAETNASSHATTALGAKTDAETAETNASSHSTTALGAKNDAETAQTGAETAETNASSYSTTALGAKTDAETAETNASSHATTALGAKTGAETAETNAGSHSTTALGAKTDAETAQGAAETAQTGAETAETNAGNSATEASSHATTALGYANNASDSADVASSHATTAQDAADSLTVIDNLTSTSSTNALSANQGKVLNDGKVEEAPEDTNQYARKDAGWVQVEGGDKIHLEQTPQGLTVSSSTIAWNMNDGGNGFVTLPDNATVSVSTINVVAGGTYKLEITQAATASTLAFSSDFIFPGGVNPVISSTNGAIDTLEFLARSNSTLKLTNAIFDSQ